MALGAVVTGAVVVAMTILPAVWVLQLISPDEDSPVLVLGVVALFFGFAAGGFAAARSAGRSPFKHASAAAGLAWVVFIAINLIRRAVSDRPVTLTLLLTAVVFLQISVALAMGGAWLAHRKAAT